MTRHLLAAATAAGLLATVAPVATACDLEHCAGTKVVCQYVDCTRPFVRCFYTTDLEICV